jgi:hypothetical protein
MSSAIEQIISGGIYLSNENSSYLTGLFLLNQLPEKINLHVSNEISEYQHYSAN